MSERPERTYWDIVKTQFAKHRTAVWGLRVVVGLFIVATFAPVLATSSPFMVKRGGGGWEFPWFGDLLDQNVFSNGVDQFFNLLLVFSPILLAVYWLWPARRRRAMLICGGIFLWCFASVALPQFDSVLGRVCFPFQGFLKYSRKKVDWLDERGVALGLILAEERVARFEERIRSTEAELGNVREQLGTATDPNLRYNLEAEQGALDEDLAQARRKLADWRERRTEAERKAADPALEVVAIMPPIGFHHDDNDAERVTERPTYSGWGTAHILGTDPNGRDVAARLLYGIRVSLTVGVIAVMIYCTIGAIYGAIMGFFGGRVDMLMMRFVEIMICFPTLPFILIIVAVFQSRSIFLIVVGIALVAWTGPARLIRGQFLQERGQDYVMAARALGIPTGKVVFKHVLPNAIHPIFVTATFGVAAAILTESGLAFLGLGDPNVPSWGQLLYDGRLTMKGWLIFSPGIAIFLTVTVLNLVGEGLRDALDPKLRQ